MEISEVLTNSNYWGSIQFIQLMIPKKKKCSKSANVFMLISVNCWEVESILLATSLKFLYYTYLIHFHTHLPISPSCA